MAENRCRDRPWSPMVGTRCRGRRSRLMEEIHYRGLLLWQTAGIRYRDRRSSQSSLMEEIRCLGRRWHLLLSERKRVAGKMHRIFSRDSC